MTAVSIRKGRAFVGALALLAAVVFAGGIAAVVSHVGGGTTTAAPPPALSQLAPLAPAPTTTTTTAVPQPVVPASTELATPQGSIPDYAWPGGPQVGTVGIWYTYAMTLPVINAQPGWYDVRLPQRPNQSTAWVRASDVATSSTPWRIVITLSTERLEVFYKGFLAMNFGVGIGEPRTPTVTGHYFMTVKVGPPNASYGPFVLSTSAHSDAIQSWEGAGDAIIAIHGPITSYADSVIGSGHAQVSNGCVRMHDVDLEHLSVIPAGTPIDINA